MTALTRNVRSHAHSDNGLPRAISRSRVLGKPRVEAACAKEGVAMLTGEIWKPVVGYEGRYDVSSMGRVRSYLIRGARPGRRRVIPVVLKQSTTRNNYQQVGIRHHDGTRYDASVHVLALEAFVGPRPAGHQACHNNGDPQDNNIENLRWDTPAANAADRRSHGRFRFGEKAPQAKLTERQVRDIKRLLAGDPKPRVADVARRFGVYKSTVYKIMRGDRWPHVYQRGER